MQCQTPDDLIVLVPGFLGFESIFNVHYFAELVAKQLADTLRDEHGIATEVQVSRTLPAARLDRRRERLVSSLRAYLRGRRRTPRIHLVGHSTGGLDAYALATGLHPSDAPDEPAIREHIRTVVTLGAPMCGTSIVRARAVREARGPWFALRMLASFPRDARHAVITDPLMRAIALDLARRPWHALRYLHELATDDALLDHLDPDTSDWVCPPHREGLAVAHYVTLAAGSWCPPSILEREDGHGTLYEAFIALVQDGQRDLSLARRAARWPAIASRIRSGEIIASAEGRSRLDGVSDVASDGVVDSALQIVRTEDLHGVVIADHLDVVGHYRDGGAPRAQGEPALLQSEVGFLHSGSGFGHAEHRELWSSIAGVIAGRLRPRPGRGLGETLRRSLRAGVESVMR
ncbi:esterase/lipase family protein [Sandaracinus amylolyticus]|uniref:Lipase n=1 Tax=Sandaracinus amylolyticus TaxID=927083 RepID=A0A0F6W184_9BACT|nr:hypothetical protein [Sandaracinus amylolyticus]AKF04817.1 hypothetical protein DB32_001966 [Sandaracinus amylolyticus]